jgi:hypothetical protein
MPTQNIINAATNAAALEILNRQPSPLVAPIVWETDTQTLYVKDQPTGDIIPIGGPGAYSGAISVSTTGQVTLAPNSNGGVPTALKVAYARYNNATDGGAVGLITPAINTTIPANAILIGGWVNSPTAVAATAGAATISIGTSAGSGAASLLAATTKADFTTDAIQGFIPALTTADFVKLSAAGQITLTVATNILTAGVLEIFVLYLECLNA